MSRRYIIARESGTQRILASEPMTGAFLSFTPAAQGAFLSKHFPDWTPVSFSADPTPPPVIHQITLFTAETEAGLNPVHNYTSWDLRPILDTSHIDPQTLARASLNTFTSHQPLAPSVFEMTQARALAIAKQIVDFSEEMNGDLAAQVIALALQQAYEDGEHRGASNPYC